MIDFSIVYDELVSKYYPDNGRIAQSPIRMFKYLLLKTIYDLSDVDVVERSRYDMSFKYFLEIVPEEDVIDASSLCKFRKLRLKDMDLLDLLINKTVTLAIENGIRKSTSVIVDATHTGSRANPHSPTDILKLRSKQLRKSLYEVDEKIKEILPGKNTDDILEHELTYTQTLINTLKTQETYACIPKVKEKLNLLKETLDDICDHYTVSEDEDARIGHKSEDSSFFGYKTHLGMTEERIITATVITSGGKGDGPQLSALVEQSRKNGIDVQTVIGDSAYSGNDNLEKARDEHLELVAKLNPSISQGVRKEEDKFDYNKDAGMFVCPVGHMAIRKAKQGKKKGAWNQAYTYYFDVQKCKCCTKREDCYKPGATSKTYSVPIKTDEQLQQTSFNKLNDLRRSQQNVIRLKLKMQNLSRCMGTTEHNRMGSHA